MTSMFALWTGALLAFGGPVTEVAITPSAQRTNVLIAVDGDVEYRDFAMEGPYRLVVDLMGARHALPRDEFTDINRGGIRSVRTSQYSEDVVRVVLVLDQKAEYTVTSDPRGVRISLGNAGGDFAPWSSGLLSEPATAEVLSAAVPSAAASRGRSAVGDRPLQQAPQSQQRSTARRISITFTNSPMQDVLLAFASFSGKSIVPGSNVTGVVTADIRDQPWDIALRTILSAYGLAADEDDYGIIRVDNINDLNQREEVEKIITQAHRINYATATELQTAIQPLLTERGSITVGQGTNTLVVSDIDRVQSAVRQLLTELDVRTPQVSIQAKIVFVNRTDLDEMGVTYELKDSRGNQLNQLSEGAADFNGDGVLTPDEAVAQGEAVVLLGGNSVAALGNAKERLASPSLSLLTSLVVGRHQLISFLDALSSVQLSDVQAIPQVTTLDNQQARLKVGTDVPVRTILEATPHVTANGNILLELSAERSSAEIAASDAGFVKQTQEARTRVLVEDGETVVIAGLTQSERTEFRSGIPLLMDLPIIGRLFRVKREQVIQRDLIILVTPHIVRGSN
jgi:type IV pilus assembly protein PilQ